MTPSRFLCRLMLVVSPTLVGSPAFAQQQASSIAGLVRDTTGAVLPGVTVEARSPVLIEKFRTAVSDGDGQYRITDLPPGTYGVTFSLPGFNTVRREGVTLTAGFAATINAELPVGALEETVTVSGASPLVDVQNVLQRKTVTDDLLQTLPTSTITLSNIGTITPGIAGTVNIGGAAGVYSMSSVQVVRFHGKAGGKTMFDGMRINSMGNVGSDTGYIPNPATLEEFALETGGASAESAASGVLVNFVPKSGGNAFSGSVSGLYTNDALQSENLTGELRSRGLATANKVLYLFNADGALGGPVARDKLWFFTAHRISGNQNQVAGVYFNKTQGAPLYTPDFDRPGFRDDLLNSHALRMTWQISPRNRLNMFGDIQRDCMCRGRGEFAAPEAVLILNFFPAGLAQTTWSSPVTSRLLLEARAGAVFSHWPTPQPPEVGPNDISTTEQSTGFGYNSNSSYGGPRIGDRFIQQFSASYITGSHAFKAGVQLEEGTRTFTRKLNGDVSYRFLNGIPNQITQVATPYQDKERLKAELGLYVQDQWTMRRLTLNLGLRFDYLDAFVPEQHLDAGPWVPARDFAAVKGLPSWSDVNPRVGAAYDLLGNGRTALKVALGRYVASEAVSVAQANSPVVTSVNTVNRTWNDANGNFVPDCDLRSPVANGECGAFDNSNFGRPNITTRWDDDILRGFGVRNYLWDFSAEVQQQLFQGLSVTAGYYRNWHNNFRVTDNLEVTPDDFSPYCVTAPIDPRLPGGGGYQVCGLYDISPAKFGSVNNLVSDSARFGRQTQTNDFFNVTASGRVGSRLQLGGGVDTGRTVLDACFVADSPQALLDCRVVTPFTAHLQFKGYGTYALPGHITVSGTFQNFAGPEILASFPATNAAIAPSLGRNLAACGTRSPCNATATVPLIRPQTMFEDRRTQLDLRLTKRINLGPRMKVDANLDVYNVFNASAVNAVNQTYGPRWLQPVGQAYAGGAIMDGRLVQVGGRLMF